MYGTGRTFVENIQKVRQLIVNHKKWELSEQSYKIALALVQCGVVVTLYSIWKQTALLDLLLHSYDDFVYHLEKKEKEAESQRQKAQEKVSDVLNVRAQFNKQRMKEREIEELQTELRRALLPTSEDYHSIVRERMRRYHERKHHGLLYPV